MAAPPKRKELQHLVPTWSRRSGIRSIQRLRRCGGGPHTSRSKRRASGSSAVITPHSAGAGAADAPPIEGAQGDQRSTFFM